jgi:hypothetical protein
MDLISHALKNRQSALKEEAVTWTWFVRERCGALSNQQRHVKMGIGTELCVCSKEVSVYRDTVMEM